MGLRPYQVEAVEAVLGELERVRSTLLVLPTGTGKTVTFAEIAKRVRPRGRTLIVAHREELIRQAVDKIERFAGLRCAVEMGDERAASALFTPDVVVATIQTLAYARRREQFRPDEFALVVIDEAHHAVADSYKAVAAYFAGAKVLGVTATPDRRAMKAVFDSIAYGYDVRDAIRDGHLVPIRQKAVHVEGLDLSNVRASRGDLDEAELEAILTEDRNLHGVAHPTLELAGDRPTMIFAASVAHARALADLINRWRPGVAVSLDGTTDREYRRAALQMFEAGQFQFLVNCQLLVEGFDAPRVSCIAMARPTRSRILYTQVLGRGLRLHPGKESCLVLDFEGNAGKHSLVCALDVLDGNDDMDVRAKARELAGEMDVLDALDEAARQVAAERRRKVLAEARYRAVDVDPFQILGASDRAGRYGGAAPTEKQLEVLKKSGITHGEIDKGQASALIDAIFTRRREGMCTYKQARLLAQKGLNPDVTFEQARRALDLLAANRWRPTPELLAEFAPPSKEAA